MDMDMESGGRAPAADPQNFLIGERNSASPVRHKSFPFGRLAVSGSGSGSGTVADLQNFPGRIGGSRPNGPDVAAPNMSDQMAMCFEDRVAAAMYKNSLYAFLQHDTKYSSFSLIFASGRSNRFSFPSISRFRFLIVWPSSTRSRAKAPSCLAPTSP
jgi:hypothetical protein